jgi:CheY-like chemotaxis protein
MDPAGKRMKLLAADDNPISQTSLRSMLVKWGYEVVTARNGDEAWQLLESPQAPSVAILDWMMPGQDGVEICRRLRAAGKEPYTYVLLLISRSDSQDLVEALDAGADDYLTSLQFLPSCGRVCEPAAGLSNCRNSFWRPRKRCASARPVTALPACSTGSL